MDQRIQLSNFAGPLDLLLYLVQKQEVDIREISLVKICDQYLAHLRSLENLDIELAGEFFLMAATLMSIKARSLLPREEIDLEEELDPEEELILQLLEYRKVKEAARDLTSRAVARSMVHVARPTVTDAGIPLEEVGVFDLVEAFRKILEDTGLDRAPLRTIEGERPLSSYVTDLVGRLRERPRLPFFEVFAGSKDRMDLIGLFLALLELVRSRLVRAVQDGSFGEIDIEVVGKLPENLESLADLLTEIEEAQEHVPSAEENGA
jgi:segregation and condensation protein A